MEINMRQINSENDKPDQEDPSLPIIMDQVPQKEFAKE